MLILKKRGFMKLRFLSLLLISVITVPNIYAFDFDFLKGISSKEDNKKEEQEKKKTIGSIIPGKASFTKEAILGNILKGALENMHFSRKTIDDDLSQKAFDQYIKKLDYGKQFLLLSDVALLSSNKKELDDEMLSGQLNFVEKSQEIFNKRVKEIEGFVTERLKSPFDLTKDEKIETDSDKRDFFKTMDELKEYWRKQLKLEVLSRYAELQDEQNGVVRKGDEKKKKKEDAKKKQAKVEPPKKKLNDKELEQEARTKVSKSYDRIFKRLAQEKRFDWLDKYYNSITKIYDPHTNYLPPEEKEDFDIDMSGKLEGIGALLREDGSYIKVESIIPGSASWKTKELESEDTILKVGQGDQEPVEVVDMPLRDAVKLIRGKKGSEVRLTVKKPSGAIQVVSIIRDVVEIQESYAKSTILNFKNDTDRFGYIYVPKFYRDFQDRNGRNCTDDVRNAIRDLKKQNIKGLILDLRNNGGGALDDARMMSGLFIEKGPIVQVKDHRGEIEVLEDTDSRVDYDGPLIVMINRFSASASEILAAAMQDYGRAIIVGGEYSHGKGTVQAVMDLNAYLSPVIRPSTSLGALKITIQQFYRVNGSSTQYKGVTPDIIFPDQYSYLDSGEKSLEYSLPWTEIKPVEYKKWAQKIDLEGLKKASQIRVAKSDKFKMIEDSVTFYKKKKDETVRTLTLESYLKERKELNDKVDLYKDKKINEVLLVTSIKPLKKEEDKEKFKDFQEGLQKDPDIEETMFILKDLLSKK
jgi:carboxyl-terminal processing protease